VANRWKWMLFIRYGFWVKTLILEKAEQNNIILLGLSQKPYI
jgi:hypothetical protein